MKTTRPLALFALAALSACAAQPAAQHHAAAIDPPYYVPSAALVDLPAVRPPNPYTVLASAEEQDLFFPRSERFAYGSFPLFEISSASTLTVDAQNISAPRGSGYRYSWVTRSSLSVP
jgi:hypothetical protein